MLSCSQDARILVRFSADLEILRGGTTRSLPFRHARRKATAMRGAI